MASKALKGLTIKIGGDTTELTKSLDKVEKQGRDLSSELGQINKLLKFDPKNTELLAQKQKVLADAISNTEDKLDTLREAEKQVQAQFERGEVSEAQYRALQREIIATEGKLDKYKAAAKDAADVQEDLADSADKAAKELDDVGDSAEDSGDGFTVAKGATADFIGNGLSALVGAAKDAISSVMDLAEATRDYRKEMAKLDTAFTIAGFSAEDGTKTYEDLQSILGDTGQAVEAANHLAKIAANEEELAKWTDILTGVYGMFGASLPVEGLAEAALETRNVSKVTGPFADAINWAADAGETFGVKMKAATEENEEWNKAVEDATSAEDFFNLALQECGTEQERQQLITETLTKYYGDAAKQFKETNKDVIEANKSQEELTATQAELGKSMEPLAKKFAELKTKALQWIIEKGLPALQDGFNWVKNNIPTIVGVVGALTAAWLTFGGAQKIVTAAQKVLNVVMKANPIGLIITAVTALVTAFIYLWNNCEAFRKFWIDLWEGIKKVVSAVVDWLVGAWTAVSEFFVGIWEGIKATLSTVGTWIYNTVIAPIANFFVGLWQGIVNAYHTVIDPWIEIFKRLGTIVYDNIIKPIADFFADLWAGISEGVTAAWDAVSGVLSTVGTWIYDNVITPVTDFFSDLWSSFTDGAQSAWDGVMSVFSAVGGFFSDVFSTVKDKIVSVFEAGGEVFNNIKEGIVTVFTTVVNGIIKGINTVIALPFKGLNTILDTIHDISIVGVEPFSWLTWRAPIPKIPELAKGGVLEKGQVGLLEGDGAEAVVPLEKNTKWLAKVAEQLSGLLLDDLGGLGLERSLQVNAGAFSPVVLAFDGMASKLDKILTAIEKGQVLTIDGETLVGATANAMDNALGRRRALAARGAL